MGEGVSNTIDLWPLAKTGSLMDTLLKSFVQLYDCSENYR